MSNPDEYINWPNWPPRETPYPFLCLNSISHIDPWLIVPGCLYNPLVCGWAMPAGRVWGRIASMGAPWVLLAIVYTFLVCQVAAADPEAAVMFIALMEVLVFPTILPAVAAAMIFTDVKSFVDKLPLEEISITPLAGREFRAGLLVPSLPFQLNCCWGMLGFSLLLTIIPCSTDAYAIPGLIFLAPAFVRPVFNSILVQSMSVAAIRHVAFNESIWRFLLHVGGCLFKMTLRYCFCVFLFAIAGAVSCMVFVGIAVVPVAAFFVGRYLRDSARELLDEEVINANWDLRRDRDTIAEFWRARQESAVR